MAKRNEENYVTNHKTYKTQYNTIENVFFFSFFIAKYYFILFTYEGKSIITGIYFYKFIAHL